MTVVILSTGFLKPFPISSPTIFACPSNKKKTYNLKDVFRFDGLGLLGIPSLNPTTYAVFALSNNIGWPIDDWSTVLLWKPLLSYLSILRPTLLRIPAHDKQMHVIQILHAKGRDIRNCQIERNDTKGGRKHHFIRADNSWCPQLALSFLFVLLSPNLAVDTGATTTVCTTYRIHLDITWNCIVWTAQVDEKASPWEFSKGDNYCAVLEREHLVIACDRCTSFLEYHVNLFWHKSWENIVLPIIVSYRLFSQDIIFVKSSWERNIFLY